MRVSLIPRGKADKSADAAFDRDVDYKPYAGHRAGRYLIGHQVPYIAKSQTRPVQFKARPEPLAGRTPREGELLSVAVRS